VSFDHMKQVNLGLKITNSPDVPVYTLHCELLFLVECLLPVWDLVFTTSLASWLEQKGVESSPLFSVGLFSFLGLPLLDFLITSKGDNRYWAASGGLSLCISESVLGSTVLSVASVSSSPQNLLKTLPSLRQTTEVFFGPSTWWTFLLSWKQLFKYIVNLTLFIFNVILKNEMWHPVCDEL